MADMLACKPKGFITQTGIIGKTCRFVPHAHRENSWKPVFRRCGKDQGITANVLGGRAGSFNGNEQSNLVIGEKVAVILSLKPGVEAHISTMVSAIKVLSAAPGSNLCEEIAYDCFPLQNHHQMIRERHHPKFRPQTLGEVFSGNWKRPLTFPDPLCRTGKKLVRKVVLCVAPAAPWYLVARAAGADVLYYGRPQNIMNSSMPKNSSWPISGAMKANNSPSTGCLTFAGKISPNFAVLKNRDQ